MALVDLRINGGWASIGGDGIRLRRGFPVQEVLLPWANVMFVSPIPAVRRNENGWDTFRGEPITSLALAEKLRFYAFEVAIHDRHQLWKASKFLTRFWLSTSLFIKALFTASGRPHEREGCLSIGLNERWVRKNGEQVIRALEAFEMFSKFDLLCSYCD